MTKIDSEIKEALFDPKKSKQKQFEKQCKAKAHASPQERAAAFARMRETGTLRGYDPKAIEWFIVYHGTNKKAFDDILKTGRLKYPFYVSTVQGEDYGTHEIAVHADKRDFRVDPEDDSVVGYTSKPKWFVSKYDLHFDVEKVGNNFAELTTTHKIKHYDPVPPARWYEAMVKGIKKSSDVRNPYAVVKSIWAKLSPSKRAEFRAREKKGEQFRYDLPLPVDKPTRGTGTVRMVKPFKLAEVQVNLSVKDYLTARASGLFQKMKREDGTTALVARCKSPQKNVNVFVDKAGK